MRRALLLLVLGLSACRFTTVGIECKKHEDCNGFDEGYCSRAEICTRVCDRDDQCPVNTTCSLQGSRRVCLPTCAAPADCPRGLRCTEEGLCVLDAPFEPALKVQ